ncbi:AAA family ATPase/60S ribosome export protein Rix7/60S ribosome export protein/Rix7 [Zymoseptoria brevis]|uniref:AAA family ATPase/60S ribosome export protein Rix7/60S ribosome export protein/Rix7 n=1 Tax=Zymoseptoria brevis TaxID=1047168 RepID=A0A0F4GXP5_9PEZI|nr:AAA family ATPase/60S ribosome export protein Rix7/60S ribosome export protein/Rix7 [Zymoseptoria brevis]
MQGAIDRDVHVAVQKFMSDGVSPDVASLYAAIQKSNSSLKRRPKKIIQASVERVLEFMGIGDDEFDSEAAIDDVIPDTDPVAELMNKSLRANLAARPVASSASAGTMPTKRRSNGESPAKRQKRTTEEATSVTAPMDVSLSDVGGMDTMIKQMTRQLVMPIGRAAKFHEARYPMPKGILLHGPPGCGKTMLCRAYAAELKVPFIEILGPSIVSGMSGESEKAVREKFDEAKRNAPCLLFIDEIDAIAPKRDTSQSQMEKRIVAQLLVSMDDLQKDPSKPVIVLAATNRPDSLDPALRRGGRFGSEINLNVPNEQVRKRILETQTREMLIDSDVDFAKLAKMTAGFVGADLLDLVGKAAAHQMERYQTALEDQADALGLPIRHSSSDSLAVVQTRRLIARLEKTDLPDPPGFEKLSLSMKDFVSVLPEMTPSSKREGFSTVPDVSWKDIGALESVRAELQRAIVNPIEKPAKYERFGVNTPPGVLLWGPPGCGKTLLAKAAAAESKANFISIKGPELLNKFVGESEAAVRKVFTRARSSVPCVIFFDELDALVPKRDEAGSEASSRVVNTLLTELDGLSVRAGIYVIAATNRPDMIDEAMLRPGRLGTTLFVDLPGPEERVDILRAIIGSKPCEFTPEIANIARGEESEGYSGADMGALLHEAIMHAIDRDADSIEVEDFKFATGRIKRSVKDVRKYRELQKTFGQR